ncbi:MAG: hypothetical protein U0905_16595 [Pirellulales bacterium]
MKGYNVFSNLLPSGSPPKRKRTTQPLCRLLYIWNHPSSKPLAGQQCTRRKAQTAAILSRTAERMGRQFGFDFRMQVAITSTEVKLSGRMRLRLPLGNVQVTRSCFSSERF